MTTTPASASTGRPAIVDMAAWGESRDALLAREKAHTREGDAIAAERRRLPMAEFDGATLVTGANGPVPFIDLFEGRGELVVYKHMWHDGAPHQGQCEGCTVSAWHLRDAAYLNARGVSFAILTTGAWHEVEPYLQFMGYSQPWFSVGDLPEPIGDNMGSLAVFLRDGDRVFLTYDTTGRGTEVTSPHYALLDMTPYGRREAWQDNPEGCPEGNNACWYWRSDVNGDPGWDTTRPTPQWTRPGVTAEDHLGRANHGH